ncbi:MAG TPA: superoxide dismutase family protein [Gemmatimonadales bacterium]
MRWAAHVTGWGLLGFVGLPSCTGEGGGARGPSTLGQTGATAESSAPRIRAKATIAGAPGSDIKGEVTFVELEGNMPVPGVEIQARITGPADRLTPGPHGLHIHENAKGGCVPPFKSAGGHFDPGPAGNPDPDVNHPYHLGDIPNLVVDNSGKGEMKATTSRITLGPGPLTLFDTNGSVIVVHEKPDQGVPGKPESGISGGPRIACGVIELDPGGG